MAIRSHFSDLLNQRIKELAGKVSLDLAHGSAATIEDYRQQVGRVQGLEEALEIAADIDRQISGE